MNSPFRRVVTGHDERGRSVIRADFPAPSTVRLDKAGGLLITELWATRSSPADNGESGVPGEGPMSIEPAAGGTVFRVIEYPPDSERLKSIAPDSFFSSMGATRDSSGTRRHPGMHRTDTVDYAIILEGEIFAVMDEGESLLRKGDVLIQRGTNHAWSNRTEKPCLIAFVLVSAHPIPGA